MSNFRTWIVDKPENVSVRDVDFGLVDPRGRHMGMRFTTYEDIFEEIPEGANSPYAMTVRPGRYFALDCQTIRNGKPYGYGPPVKHFQNPSEREIAIGRYTEDSRYRAAQIGRLPSGELAVSRESHAKRYQQRTENIRKREEKASRKAERAAKVTAEIPLVEAELEQLLNDNELMTYLKDHPWPIVIPGPPSMAYTAFDHVVGKQLKFIEYSEKEEPSYHLSTLRSALKLLKEQRRRFARGLLPDSESVPGFVRMQVNR